jgi:AcrR family transcriptional regulator
MTCPRDQDEPVSALYFTTFVEGRRGEIMDAALGVIGDKGYEAGTMREIAARVGVSEPALYRHYASKEALLTDIVAVAGDRIAGNVSRALAEINGSNLVPALHGLIETRRRVAARKRAARAARAASPEAAEAHPGDVMHTLFHAAPHNEAFIVALRTHLTAPMVAAVRELIPRVDADQGITRAPGEVDELVRVFVSLFVGYFTTSAMFGEAVNDDVAVRAVLAIMGWEPEGKPT